MKKQELLKYFDDELLERLFGFCYARAGDSYEAEELCSDIVFALVKSANTDGEIESVYPFIWRVARNVYADHLEQKRRRTEHLFEGDPNEALLNLPDEDDDNSRELLSAVWRRIAFLTKAYREVMILFYLEGLPTAEIAKMQNTSEGAIRQRLFAARQKIKSEVEEMAEAYNKPVALDKIEFNLIGTGSPDWGDPRDICTRMFSNHIVWLCHKKPRSASEIAEELNVPTVYVEEELEILRKGANGKYGLLRRLENGKYAINFILFDKELNEKARAVYIEQLPKICEITADFIEKHKEEYLAFPYLNKNVDLNLVLWQQMPNISCALNANVYSILKNKHFADIEKIDRPFTVFGFVDNGESWGCGCETPYAHNVCGFSLVQLYNMYCQRIKKHFGCGLNISKNAEIQLAIRAIEGLDVASLSENEKEHAAKAIKQGYIYREGDMLYTKILVHSMNDADKLYTVSAGLFESKYWVNAEEVADRLAKLIKDSIPEYLYPEWERASDLAYFPVFDALTDSLIEKGILLPPENGIGAEGCWMGVKK